MATVAGDAVAVRQLTVEAVRTLLSSPAPPCLSLYLPTHRIAPHNSVDRPSFRNLIESLEAALHATCSRTATERLLHPLRQLLADEPFWQHAQDGLAALAANGRADVFLLQQPARPLAMLGDRFHLMPLVRAATAIERFHVLCLTSRAARVWAGRIWHDPHGDVCERLDPVSLIAPAASEPVEEVTRDAATSAEILEPHRVKHGMGPAGRRGVSFVHGGFGSKRDDIDRDTEIFLRYVDELVYDQVSRPTELPLVLVAPARLAASFLGLARNPLLLEEYVDLDVHLVPAAARAAAVAEVFGRAREHRVAKEIQRYVEAREHGRGASDLADIARAAVAGQVATLLVEADRFETGHLDRLTGAVDLEPRAISAVRIDSRQAISGEDLYGAIAEIVFAKGGSVVTLGRTAMPTETGVAAIFRYA